MAPFLPAQTFALHAGDPGGKGDDLILALTGVDTRSSKETRQLGRARPHLRALGARCPRPVARPAGSGCGCGGAAGGEARHRSPSAEPVPMAAPVPTGPEDDASAVLDELSRNFTYWAPGPGNGSLSSAWYRRNQVRPPPAPGRSDRRPHAGPAEPPGLPVSSPRARQRPCEWAERHVTPPHVHPLPSSQQTPSP